VDQAHDEPELAQEKETHSAQHHDFRPTFSGGEPPRQTGDDGERHRRQKFAGDRVHAAEIR
jgi:hypothetical protein